MIFYKETKFQETSIGRFPKEWNVVILEDICEKVRAGGTPLTSKKEYWNGDLPFVKIEDITLAGKYLTATKSFISKEGLSNSNAWLVPENSLLFAMYGSMGEVSINKIPVTTNQAILGIIPKDKDDAEFLYYWFSFFKPRWRKYAKPTTQANLTAEIVRNSMIPLPSKRERQEIAKVLGVVDSVIAKTGEVIAKTERLKKGLMQTLLTRGIGHKEYKQTPIGTIPKEWHVTKLGEIIIKLKRGPSKQTNDSGVGVVYLTSDYITDDGFLIFENLKFLEENLIDDVDKYLLEPNDVLVNCVNSVDKIGKVAVFEGYSKRTIVGFNNFALTLASHVNPFFLKYVLLQDRYKAIFRSIGKAAVQQVSFSSKDLLRVEVPIPQSMSEQEEIVAVLSTIDKKLRIEKNEKIKFERIKRSLMDLLLTGKIRVKVD